MGLITCTDFEGYYVLSVALDNQTKYMRAFTSETNKEDALEQVLKDIQVSNDKQS